MLATGRAAIINQGMISNPMNNYNILLVDSDVELSRVLRGMLREMGFVNCDSTTSGINAFQMLQNEPFDFLIMDWHLQHASGIELLKKVRRSPHSPHPTMPAIMLTGRAEQSDVFLARDMGINEFVVKPFSAKAIYNRIERIIEQPRQFVISQQFIGPTRRVRGNPPPGEGERRLRKITPQLQPHDVHGSMRGVAAPRIWLPDFSLKYKLGNNVRLDSLITDAVLSQAQAAVDAISNESLGWVKTNLNDMRILYKLMTGGKYPATIVQDIGELALTINSRAGTFGYGRASEIAYLLYIFCRSHLNPANKDHHMIVGKHIDVLHVILGNQMMGSAGALGDQMVSGLTKLAEKFSA